jgi:hypothetical protein
MAHCTNCGNSLNGRFCANCGHPADAASQAAAPRPTTQQQTIVIQPGLAQGTRGYVCNECSYFVHQGHRCNCDNTFADLAAMGLEIRAMEDFADGDVGDGMMDLAAAGMIGGGGGMAGTMAGVVLAEEIFDGDDGDRDGDDDYDD